MEMMVALALVAALASLPAESSELALRDGKDAVLLNIKDDGDVNVKNESTKDRIRLSVDGTELSTITGSADTMITVTNSDGSSVIEFDNEVGIRDVVTIAKRDDESFSIKVMKDSPLAGRTVVLDPGHGGFRLSRAIYGGIAEKDSTLQIAELVRKKLEYEGICVIMTRTDDRYVSLTERAAMSNRAKADLFVSIHHNANKKPFENGLSTDYNKPEDWALAKFMNDGLVKDTKRTDNGAIWNEFTVNAMTDAPNCLIEMLYLSNEGDRDYIRSHHELLAESVSKNIVKWLENEYGDK